MALGEDCPIPAKNQPPARTLILMMKNRYKTPFLRTPPRQVTDLQIHPLRNRYGFRPMLMGLVTP